MSIASYIYKREAALEAERAKIAELEISVEQLEALSTKKYLYIALFLVNHKIS